jgi:hypothetical protein
MLSAMRILTRLVVIGALVWLAAVLFMDARQQANEAQPDGMKVFMYFGAVVLIAVVVGGIVAMSVVPAIGEAIGSYFFNPNEQIEKDPHHDAVACIAKGDYKGAIDHYRRVFNENTADVMAMSEVVHLYCDKLQDTQSAEQELLAALQHDLTPEQNAFLTSRLADVYWNYQRDAARARPLLVHIAENLPDTKYAANAMHRIREIDHALEQAGLNPDQSLAADTEPPATPDNSHG